MTRYPNEYGHHSTGCAWRAWHARASQVAAPPAQPVSQEPTHWTPDQIAAIKDDVTRMRAKPHTLNHMADDAAPQPVSQEPVAWLVQSKSGMIRTAWTTPPLAEQLAVAQCDGDAVTPLYATPQPATEQAELSEWKPSIVQLSDAIVLFENADLKGYPEDGMHQAFQFLLAAAKGKQ
jgi:hypothetical protein